MPRHARAVNRGHDQQRELALPRPARRHNRDHRAGRAVAALALGAGLVAGPWVSVSASAQTPGQSVAASGPSSSQPARLLASELCTEASSDPCCATSLGAYPYPESDPSLPPLPSWASFVGSPRCVLLDATSLRPEPASPLPVDVVSAPSQSPGLSTEQGDALLAEVDTLRDLYLFSVGLTIFLLAGIFMRSRKG